MRVSIFFIAALMGATGVMAHAAVVSEPNWSTGKSKDRTFENYLLHRDRVKSQNIYSYKNDGLSVPSLTINLPIEYITLPGPASHEPQGAGIDINTKGRSRHITPNAISLATQACLYLDLELTQKLGAWGAECKITQFLQMPTHGDFVKRIAPNVDNGDYYYTPRKPDTQDVVRFILENGAGKKVEVTVHLKAGSDDSYYGVSDGTKQ